MRADNIQKTIESQIADLQDQLLSLRGNLGARGADMYDQANEQARLAMRQMRRQAAKVGKVARDNPETTTAVLAIVGLTAFGLGYLVGRIGSEE